jgi:hypothetical protein
MAPSTRRRAPQTLSTSLRKLEDVDPACVVIVRRINKLGFKATRALKHHFSAYGQVVQVLLAHSTAKQFSDQQFVTKRRPTNLGYIQMASAEMVMKILADGEERDVEGVQIAVQRFQRPSEVEEEQEWAHEDSVDLAEDFEVVHSVGKRERGMSDLSTATGSTRATMDESPARR